MIFWTKNVFLDQKMISGPKMICWTKTDFLGQKLSLDQKYLSIRPVKVPTHSALLGSNSFHPKNRRDIVEHEVFKLHNRNRRSVSDAPAGGAHEYTANILTVGPMRSKERWVDETATGTLDTSKFDSFKNSFLSIWKTLFGSKFGSTSSSYWGSSESNYRSLHA